jgi:hypothetical protein
LRCTPSSLAGPRHKRRREGRLLARVKNMGEIQRDAEIARAGLRNGEKRRADVAQHAEGRAARWACIRRRIDDRGVMGGDLAQALDLVGPQPRVIGLERRVEAVLAEPDRHQRSAAGRQRVDAPLGEIDGAAAHRRDGVREGAGPEGGITIIAHGKAVQRQADRPARATSAAGSSVPKWSG